MGANSRYRYKIKVLCVPFTRKMVTLILSFYFSKYKKLKHYCLYTNVRVLSIEKLIHQYSPTPIKKFKTATQPMSRKSKFLPPLKTKVTLSSVKRLLFITC